MTVKCPYCGEEMVLDEVCDDKEYYECPACGYTKRETMNEKKELEKKYGLKKK